MPNILTEASVITCPHGGTVQVTASQNLFTVGGKRALVQADLIGAPIPDCPIKPTPGGPTPCLTVTSVLSGLATKLTVGGQPVLLDTATGLTDGAPPPELWTVQSAGQTKLQTT